MYQRPWLMRKLEPIAWWLMTKTIKFWVNHFMDQFENYKFQCQFGYTTYVSISYMTEYPAAYYDIDTGEF